MKKDLERKLRAAVVEYESTTGERVKSISLVEIDHRGLLGPDIDHAIDIRVDTERLPARRWMQD